MRRFWFAMLAFAGLVSVVAPAQARVQVSVDLTRQRMNVTSSTGSYSWPVSSARSGFVTPRGSYAPTALVRMHYSRKYHMSPMPHSIFFRGGYAIHGTSATGALGSPASHGCIRLAPGNAAALFAMVQREGASIAIHGSPPQGRTLVAKRMPRPARYAARRMYDDMPYAYAPIAPGYSYYAPTVRRWQGNPYGW